MRCVVAQHEYEIMLDTFIGDVFSEGFSLFGGGGIGMIVDEQFDRRCAHAFGFFHAPARDDLRLSGGGAACVACRFDSDDQPDPFGNDSLCNGLRGSDFGVEQYGGCMDARAEVTSSLKREGWASSTNAGFAFLRFWRWSMASAVKVPRGEEICCSPRSLLMVMGFMFQVPEVRFVAVMRHTL